MNEYEDILNDIKKLKKTLDNFYKDVLIVKKQEKKKILEMNNIFQNLEYDRYLHEKKIIENRKLKKKYKKANDKYENINDAKINNKKFIKLFS